MRMRKKRIKLEIGTVVRDYRIKAGLSQEKLSERMNTSRQYISSIEKNSRVISVETMVRLAQALGISPVEIFQDIINRSSILEVPRNQGGIGQS